MKKIITLLTILFAVLSTTTFAQSQPYFNYQAVIRDNTGGLLVNRLVNIKIALREGNASGTIAYQEVHTTTTNSFGLVNLVVGAGAPLQGTMPTVNWGDDTHFIDIELDANNTGVYTQMGATQILSVPYALHARTVEFNDDADADPTNEIQQFVLQNNVLYLDNGGNFINLNPYLDNTDNQVISVFDSTTTIRNMLISGGNKVTFSVADIDNDSINELQTVFLLNDTIFLNRGGFVDLKPYLDNTDEQNLTLSNDTLVITGSNDTLSLSDYRQNLTLANDTLVISGSNDTISLVSYLDNTDEQNLTLLNDTLVITGSNDTISLSEFRQELSLSNDTLSLSGSNFVVLPPDDDGDSTNEIQTLSLMNDTLYLDLSGDTIDLVPYLDNTDEQNLTLQNDTLVITGSNDTISLSEFRQELSLNNDTLSLSGSNFVVLPPDADGDSTNEIQTLSLMNDTLYLDLSGDTIDLLPYLDNTDEQTLSLLNDTLVISGSSDTISLISYLDNTDNQILTISNDTIYLEDGGFVELPAGIATPDLNRTGDNINIVGSPVNISIRDNDADSTNEIQRLSFLNDTLILSISEDTIDLSGYSLRIDTNSSDIASIYIELDSDSTNFDTLISDLSSTQEMADSMIYAKIASDSTNFDTLIEDLASNLSDTASAIRTDLASEVTVLYATMVADSNVVHSALVDTAGDLRTAIGASLTSANSTLSDTASAIRTDLASEVSTLNSRMVADSNVVHSALVDTAGDLRTAIGASLTSANSTLSDTASAIRTDLASEVSTLNSRMVTDSNVVHSALIDSSSALRTFSSTIATNRSNTVQSALSDTASALRTAISANSGTDNQNLTFTTRRLAIERGNTVDLRTLSDSAMSALTDTAAALRTFVGNSAVSKEHLRNKLDTVTEFIHLSYQLDLASNPAPPVPVYLPIQGVIESTDITNDAVSLLAHYDGEIVSVSLRSSITIAASQFGFHKNENTTASAAVNYFVPISAGVTTKSNIPGAIVNKQFSAGDLLHFKYFVFAGASEQKIRFTIELKYYK